MGFLPVSIYPYENMASINSADRVVSFNLLPETFLSFMAKCPAISTYQAHLSCVTGGGGYTYRSWPLWWFGITTIMHVPHKTCCEFKLYHPNWIFLLYHPTKLP
jgi:acetoin utilization deacetylase AcuC-like enzyme